MTETEIVVWQGSLKSKPAGGRSALIREQFRFYLIYYEHGMKGIEKESFSSSISHFSVEVALPLAFKQKR